MFSLLYAGISVPGPPFTKYPNSLCFLSRVEGTDSGLFGVYGGFPSGKRNWRESSKVPLKISFSAGLSPYFNSTSFLFALFFCSSNSSKIS